MSTLENIAAWVLSSLLGVYGGRISRVDSRQQSQKAKSSFKLQTFFNHKYLKMFSCRDHDCFDSRCHVLLSYSRSAYAGYFQKSAIADDEECVGAGSLLPLGLSVG